MRILAEGKRRREAITGGGTKNRSPPKTPMKWVCGWVTHIGLLRVGLLTNAGAVGPGARFVPKPQRGYWHGRGTSGGAIAGGTLRVEDNSRSERRVLPPERGLSPNRSVWIGTGAEPPHLRSPVAERHSGPVLRSSAEGGRGTPSKRTKQTAKSPRHYKLPVLGVVIGGSFQGKSWHRPKNNP